MEETLTRRETQVAELVAWGASQKEIPDLLPGKKTISTHTVSNIVASIYAKLELRSNTELSAWWFCRHFGIDPGLSPLRRKIGAMVLLAILLPATVTASGEQFCRCRVRTASTVRASRTRENDNTTTYEL